MTTQADQHYEAEPDDGHQDDQPGAPTGPGGRPADQPDGTPAENPSGRTGEEVAEPHDERQAEQREGTDPA
jgi:hypothetical protein